MMQAITLKAYVGEDRRLVIELPPEVPSGDVTVTISVAVTEEDAPLTRQEVRRRLRAGGLLAESDYWDEFDDLEYEEDPNIQFPIPLPPGSPPSEVLISEDREERF